MAPRRDLNFCVTLYAGGEKEYHNAHGWNVRKTGTLVLTDSKGKLVKAYARGTWTTVEFKEDYFV